MNSQERTGPAAGYRNSQGAFNSKHHGQGPKTNEYANSSFYPLNNATSPAINHLKTKSAMVEQQTQVYRRLYTTNPKAPPSAGAKAVHSVTLATPGIRRDMRVKSAPMPFAAFHPDIPNSFKPHGTGFEKQLIHLPGMNGQISPRIQNSINFQLARQAVELNHAKFAVKAMLKATEKVEAKPPEVAKINLEAQVTASIMIKKEENKASTPSLKQKLTTGWAAAKEKVSQYRQQETASAHLSVLTDLECPAEELREALEELVEKFYIDYPLRSWCCQYSRGSFKKDNRALGDPVQRLRIAANVVQQESYAITYNSALAFFSINKQNGIGTLLKAVEVCGKAAILNLQKAQSSTTKKANVVASALTKFAKKKINLGSQTLLSMESENELGPEIHVTDDDKKDEDEYDEDDELNLMSGLLKYYFEPGFQDKMDKFDRNHKTQIIKHLLSIFEKVDKLLSVTMYISLEVDLSRAMMYIQSDAEELVQADTVKVYLLDQNSKELYIPLAKEDLDKGLVSQVRHPIGIGIAGWCAQHEESLNIKDASNHELFDPDVDFYDFDSGTANSILCVPIKDLKGRVLGVLEAVNKITNDESQDEFFTDEDENLLRILGRQSGLVISNAQIYETMLKTQKKVEVLLETTKMLGSTLNLDALIKMIMEAAKDLLQADRCTLFLADFEKKQLKAHIQGRDTIQEIRIHMNQGIAGYSFTRGENVNIPDAYSDPRFNPQVDRQTGYVTKNILCMPISNVSGKVIGVTQMINKFDGPFGTDDINILGSFCSQAAVAIEKSYLFKQNEDIRVHLESILSSITSCVITLSEDLKLTKMNRDWVANALGVTEKIMRDAPIKVWLGDENAAFYNDIQQVLATNEPIYSAEYSLKGSSGTSGSKFVNYQIMPLIGNETRGIVLILEDISSEKRAIMTLGRCVLFSLTRYMSPALAKQVMEEDGGQLGGKRKKVAILFSDIRSFTTLTESMEPHTVVELLNHHFSDAVNAILAEQGILDKYIGDAVMAVFGVPFVTPEDSIHCCNAALRMLASLKISNELRKQTGTKQIKIGIGINTGMASFLFQHQVLSGNIGSEKRMEFSCIGDAVNLSSRIEGLTKYYKCSILITEYTKNETGDLFWTREIDTVMVVGRTQPVIIYELIGRKPPPNPEAISQDTPHEEPMEVLPPLLEQTLQCYAKGLELYKRWLFQDAMENFHTAIDLNDDGPSKTMFERCQTYLLNPPPRERDMVYYCDSK